ncbi:MAG TPA: sodium-dependent transporter [Myxococcales bacterium]|jgi:NSS family neurotransmitter:Na+ symporter|nr:sodium-dependent transporter [Myxococcales bacterium]
MDASNGARDSFGSRLGFILAAAGSAIGLGNIWRFPYMAGENGGGAFVLIYLLCVLVMGIPVLLAELALGRATQRNPVGAFKTLAPKSWWPAVGALGVVTGFGILAFYSVIAGWTLGYLFKAIAGDFSAGLTADQSAAQFSAFIASPGKGIACAAVFLALTVLVVRGGIAGGIERTAKVLMPAFLLILVVLALRSVTLPGAGKGIEFLFNADFSKITPRVVMCALGQALFSLSLGMGAMITFGSYLKKEENIPFVGVAVALSDTFVALLAGLIIFPALFSAGVDPKGGPGLVFVVLPTIFDQLPAGGAFAVAFYVLLGIAALSSTVSLLEVVVAYFVDERGWKREKAVWTIGGLCLLLAIPSALSSGAVGFLTTLLGKTGGFLDLQNILFGNFSLALGALLISLFVGWRWGIRNAVAELRLHQDRPLAIEPVWGFLVRFVCPAAVAVVFGFILYFGEYF